MKISAMALVAAAVLTAGSAAASDRVSDLDYLKASRCKGLAAGLGADTTGLDSFLKAQSRSRSPEAIDRAANEMNRAKRQTTGQDGRDRLNAELSGPCVAYSGPGKDMASAH